MPEQKLDESEEIIQIFKTKSFSEIKQDIADCLKDIEYEVLRNNLDEVESRLEMARKLVRALKYKKFDKGVFSDET